MEKIDVLQKTLNYIEENLETDLTVKEIASVINYSVYHYYDLFKKYLGMPVFSYITKRRLKHAIYDASLGMTIITVALKYCFDTHSGFYKAFKKEYGCSPKKYLLLCDIKKPQTTNLKKESKIVMNKKEVKTILKEWNVSASDIEVIKNVGGNYQTKVVWNIDNKYILKVGKDISGARVNNELTSYLSDNNIKVSTALKTLSGQDLLVKDDMYYLLMEKLPGSVLSSNEIYLADTENIAKEYGRAVGNLHKALEKFDSEFVTNDKDIFDIVKRWALPECKVLLEQWGCGLPHEFYDNYLNVFEDLSKELPKHIIHRDPNPHNIIFKDNKFLGFIDFEISERNVRIFDPCYCATGILYEASNEENSFEAWKEILHGIFSAYNDEVNLSEAEKKAIPYVIYSIQMIFIAYLKGNHESKDMAKRNREMLLYLWKNANIFNDLI